MTASDLQRHIRYNNWASQLLMQAIYELPPGELERTLDAYGPWAVIDAAGNPELVADVCERRALPFTTYSPHAPDASATLDMLLDDSCGTEESPEQSAAVA